jgi:hypothetical protein
LPGRPTLGRALLVCFRPILLQKSVAVDGEH